VPEEQKAQNFFEGFIKYDLAEKRTLHKVQFGKNINGGEVSILIALVIFRIATKPNRGGRRVFDGLRARHGATDQLLRYVILRLLLDMMLKAVSWSAGCRHLKEYLLGFMEFS